MTIHCDRCQSDPGVNPRNQVLWNGFFDLDTKQHICNRCKEDYYKEKSSTRHQGLYSEMPVTMTLMYQN